jgi:surfactin synthase thioesterase subunit
MEQTQDAELWLPNYGPRAGARVRLFCFPYAGGGASFFHAWPGGFPSSVEIRPVLLPGRESRIRETPLTSTRLLRTAIADALSSLVDMPYAFFGHSLGALLAFETAHELQNRGLAPPAALFVSAKTAPHLPPRHPPIFDLPERGFLDHLRRLYDPPEEAWAIPELMELLLPVLRADLEVCDRYVYPDEPRLECPVHAYGGSHDPATPIEDLEAWRELTGGDFSMQLFPGSHFYLNTSLDRVQGAIAETLERIAT